jgi:hypothetical protein
MTKLLLAALLTWHVPIHAEQALPPWENQREASAGNSASWLDDVDTRIEPLEASQPHRSHNSGSNHFSQFVQRKSPVLEADSLEDLGITIPPVRKIPDPGVQDKLITKYYRGIRPGDKLPDGVYQCVRDNIDGIGSDMAATLVWQSRLRLNLE